MLSECIRVKVLCVVVMELEGAEEKQCAQGASNVRYFAGGDLSGGGNNNSVIPMITSRFTLPHSVLRSMPECQKSLVAFL